MQGPLLFFELSGEQPGLARQEVLSLARTYSPSSEEIAHGPGYCCIRLEEDAIPHIAARVALSHRIGRLLGWADDLDSLDPSLLPMGTFSVRAKRYDRAQPKLDSPLLCRTLGGILAPGRKVDLNNPEIEVRAFISDRVAVHHSLYRIDRRSMEERKVAERPFFSPISLHPRYARALINMMELKEGQTLLDPFCGTGGIAMEAASMGLSALASDIDPEMVAGTERNMRHFGWELSGSAVSDIADISDHFPVVDAIVTDPPYGRSASSRGEPVRLLHARALEVARDCLRPGGLMGMVLPEPIEPIEGMELEHLFEQRVHGSLSRHYHVFRRQ